MDRSEGEAIDHGLWTIKDAEDHLISTDLQKRREYPIKKEFSMIK